MLPDDRKIAGPTSHPHNLDPAEPSRQFAPVIPEFIWFAIRATALAGCILWHRRSPSPHLVTTAAGLGILILLMLPALFEEIFGWDTFEQNAARFIDPEENSLDTTGRSSGELLLARCSLFEWIGMAFLALGITRYSKQIAASTPPVR